jgi:hypothetical protein
MMLRNSGWPYSGDEPPQLRPRYGTAAVLFAAVWMAITAGFFVYLALRVFL